MQNIALLSFLLLFAACAEKQLPATSDGSQSEETAREQDIDTSLYLGFTQGVRAVFEDRDGNYWFGSNQEGLAMFDDGGIHHFTTEDGLSDNQVRSIYQSADGRIWFECGKGVSYYDGTGLHTITERDYSSSNDWSVSPNSIWFKGDEEHSFNAQEGHFGVYRYDGGKLIFQAFPLEHHPGEENYYSVSTPFVQGKDQIWFGTYGAVIGYNGSEFTVLDDTFFGLNDLTGHLHVRALFEDSEGNLWIGNNGIGVLLYDGEKAINFSMAQALVDPLGSRNGSKSLEGTLEHVFAITEDSRGNIWFGDRDTGVWKYDGQTMTNYTMEDGLTATHVWSIYMDSTDVLWFAMADGSVCWFNGQRFEKIF